MEKELNPYNTIFALDIGTNSIVGILGISKDQGFTITHSVIKYHKKRAMIDGQIHDIPSVLEIVMEVKKQLETEVGFPLKQVSIAAAGRALRTMKITQNIPLNPNKEVTRDQIKVLEFEALKQAYEEMNSINENTAKYFCVGHSLTKFLLDDMEISNPIGQKGQGLTGYIIATFLPEIVVESLHTVMGRAGLNVDYMTLEPIAALDIIVPENIRLLNIALVDIGAGTSDIAITKEGTVVGYGMTSVAGDEITEEIAKTFLLGFDQAEILKCKLSQGEEHITTNILGETLKLSTKEVVEKIQESIDSISEKISKGIIEINGKTTSAVFLVGGGSQIPGISKGISRYLQLPENRVVMKTVEDIDNFNIITKNLTGPESITPLGIFNKSINEQREDFIEVTVNQKKHKMFKRDNLKIGDALALAKVHPRAFIPKEFKEVTIIVDEQKKIIASPETQKICIYLNDKIAGIDSAIKHGDKITMENPFSNKDKQYSLKELLPSKFHRNYLYFINDQSKSLDDLVNDADKIVLVNKYQNNRSDKNLEPGNIKKNENEKSTNIVKFSKGKPAIGTDQLIEKNKNEDAQERKSKDKFVKKEGFKNSVKEASKNGKNMTKFAKKVRILVNQDPVDIPLKNGSLIFTDIFEHIDFDRKEAKGKLVMKLNGRRAGFVDVLKEGDHIELYWT